MLANGQVHAPTVLTPGETQPIYFHSASIMFTVQMAVQRKSTLKQNLYVVSPKRNRTLDIARQ